MNWNYLALLSFAANLRVRVFGLLGVCVGGSVVDSSSGGFWCCWWILVVARIDHLELCVLHVERYR